MEKMGPLCFRRDARGGTPVNRSGKKMMLVFKENGNCQNNLRKSCCSKNLNRVGVPLLNVQLIHHIVLVVKELQNGRDASHKLDLQIGKLL